MSVWFVPQPIVGGVWVQRQTIKSNTAHLAFANPEQATQCLFDQSLLKRFGGKEVSADEVESDKGARMQLQDNVQC